MRTTKKPATKRAITKKATKKAPGNKARKVATKKAVTKKATKKAVAKKAPKRVTKKATKRKPTARANRVRRVYSDWSVTVPAKGSAPRETPKLSKTQYAVLQYAGSNKGIANGACDIRPYPTRAIAALLDAGLLLGDNMKARLSAAGKRLLQNLSVAKTVVETAAEIADAPVAG
jgi:hypothetical protein